MLIEDRACDGFAVPLHYFFINFSAIGSTW